MSLTNNVLEFRPGDKVIQIFPVARPLVGVVVGANKVEGKVYVTWNGRVMQVDPEEIQLACGSNFYGISRQASKDTQKKAQKIANALSRSGDPIDSKFHSTFEKNLIAEGIAPEDADDMAYEYQDAYKKRVGANLIDPLMPMSGEAVVVLNDGGSKPGYIGVLVGSEGTDAVIDISSGWSPVSNGCRLVKVPFNTISPISNPMREAAEKQYPGSTIANRKASVKENKRIAQRAFDLFMCGVKNVDVFNNDEFKAWVQTTNTPEGNVIVSAVVERGGCKDPLVERFPIFEQKLGCFNIQNQTDYRNAVQRIKPLIDDCKSAIMQYFRNDVIPVFVNQQVQQSVYRDRCASKEMVVIHDLNNDTSYEIESPEEAKDDTDKSAAEEAFKSKDSVTMGKVIAEYKTAGYKTLPPIPSKYTNLESEGLEGPFRMESGQIVYYDPKEGKYYDRDRDMYLENDEVEAMRKIAYKKPSASDLASIKVLYRDADGALALWGIPYDMKQGQAPRDLKEANNTKEWFYLGVPGKETKEVLEFLESVKEYVPNRPGEWDKIEKNIKIVRDSVGCEFSKEEVDKYESGQTVSQGDMVAKIWVSPEGGYVCQWVYLDKNGNEDNVASEQIVETFDEAVETINKIKPALI